MFNLPADINIKNTHAWAVCAPESEHTAIALAFAHELLSGWIGESNPDLFLVGEISKPGSIDECRTMMSDISLKPVSSKKRVAVIFAADRLLLPAANSLLKITEEPPEHVVLLFMMQTNNLLPTLRSRVRFVSLMPTSHANGMPMPRKEQDWLYWLEKSGEISDITASLEAWGSDALKNGDAGSAFKIENIRLLLDGGKLSKQMACDLVLLALKEGLAVEHLFGNFR